jgi:hypothetical protein
MNSEQIKKFISSKVTEKNKYVKIEFPKREPVYGIFITDADFQDLSAKNFWRIVTSKNFDNYNKTNDINLARIFNGSEFSRLSLLSEEF